MERCCLIEPSASFPMKLRRGQAHARQELNFPKDPRYPPRDYIPLPSTALESLVYTREGSSSRFVFRRCKKFSSRATERKPLRAFGPASRAARRNARILTLPTAGLHSHGNPMAATMPFQAPGSPSRPVFVVLRETVFSEDRPEILP